MIAVYYNTTSDRVWRHVCIAIERHGEYIRCWDNVSEYTDILWDAVREIIMEVEDV